MAASGTHIGRECFEFGPFRMDPAKQVLLRGDEPVPLTPKAFHLLLMLIRRSDEVVSKDELMKAVWPDTFVEETNLTRNIFALRKAHSSVGRRESCGSKQNRIAQPDASPCHASGSNACKSFCDILSEAVQCRIERIKN